MMWDKAIKSALFTARKMAEGGSIRDVVFDPTPMTRKSPNQRVREGHQEFEPGYVRGWDWEGNDKALMNMRGQHLPIRRAADGGAQRTAAFPEKPEGYEFFGPTDNPVGNAAQEGESWTPPPEPFEAGYPEPPPPPPGKTAREHAATLSAHTQNRPVPQAVERPAGTGEEYLTEYRQTARERLGAALLGDQPSEQRRRLVQEGIGSTGLGSQLSFSDITPVGQALQVQEALQHGDPQGAALAAVPGMAAAKPAMAAAKAFKGALKPPGILDIHPDEMKLWQHEFNSQMGTNPGGVYVDNQTGSKWYVKTPQTTDHAKNEKLAAELYKLAGVPVADVHLTAVGGKHAVASPMIDGATLNKFNPWDYEKISHLQGGFPADAWLGNYDSVGTGKDNVVVYGDKAYRIDMGGALRYRAQGKPKTDFGYDVGEFESMTVPGYKGLNNHDAAEVFGQMSPEAQAEAKATAQRIVDIPSATISDLVEKYGPATADERALLKAKLLSRRQDIAKHYGVTPGGGEGNVVPLKKAQTPEEKLFEYYKEGQGANLKPMEATPQAIAKALMVSYGEHIEPAHDIAQAIWKIADKHGYKNADKVVKELPHELWPDIDNHLTVISHHEGHNPWPELRGGAPIAKAPPQTVEPPKVIPKLMQINKTHDLPQILHSVKKHSYGDLASQEITDKQKGKIFMMLDQKSPSILAHAMFDAQLTNKQVENIYSWLKDKQKVKAVDDIYDNLVGGGADPGDFFEKTMTKGLKVNKPHWWSGFKDNYEKIYKKLTDFYKLPTKSAKQREADRIAGGYTTQAFGGYRFEHGLQDPFYEGSLFHSNMLDVAHAYAVYKNAAVHPKWWDLNHPGILSEYEHAAVQPLWLNTKDYVRVDAQGHDWTYGNDIAWDARKKYYKEHGVEPKGAIIENVHDMPGAGGGYTHPSGEPFTVYQSWDAGTRRSKWARFDPQNWLKTGLHLGIAGTMVGGMGLVGSRGNGVLIQPSSKDKPQMAQGGRMPLKPGSSKETISQNISEFHGGKTYNATKAKFGKAKADKQAIAVALSTARKYGKAGGGSALSNLALKGSSIKLGREGMLNSTIPGRTDKLPMKVKAGSYVLPADIPSALGQGNTMAGGEILKKMFNTGPYGLSPMKGGRGSIRPRLKADGGEAEPTEEGEDDHVPIIAAGGEWIVHPDVVRDIGHGDMKKGHDVLDRFVIKVRKHNIATLKKLPPPKK